MLSGYGFPSCLPSSQNCTVWSSGRMRRNSKWLFERRKLTVPTLCHFLSCWMNASDNMLELFLNFGWVSCHPRSGAEGQGWKEPRSIQSSSEKESISFTRSWWTALVQFRFEALDCVDASLSNKNTWKSQICGPFWWFMIFGDSGDRASPSQLGFFDHQPPGHQRNASSSYCQKLLHEA